MQHHQRGTNHSQIHPTNLRTPNHQMHAHKQQITRTQYTKLTKHTNRLPKSRKITPHKVTQIKPLTEKQRHKQGPTNHKPLNIDDDIRPILTVGYLSASKSVPSATTHSRKIRSKSSFYDRFRISTAISHDKQSRGPGS